MEDTAGAPGSHCPVCADSLGESVRACLRCATLHHLDCWEYAKGCAIYGCVDRPEASQVRTAAADDLSLSMGMHNGARESYDPLPIAVVAGFLLTVPFQMLVWAPLPVVTWLGLLLLVRRNWRVEPVAGELTASLSVLGVPFYWRTVSLSEIRRFGVRQSETELALTATMADGGVMSMALGIKMPLTSYALIDRFEYVIQGLKAHSKIHVVRYQSEDPATLPKRIEQIRLMAAEGDPKGRAAFAAALVAEALLLAMCLHMGVFFSSALLAVHLIPALALVVWARLLPAGWLTPRLSGWRVMLLENALRNQAPDRVNVTLSVAAAALLVGLGGWAVTATPDRWGWILWITAMGALSLAHPWLRVAWAHGCARRGVPLQPGDEEPSIDELSRLAFKARPFAVVIFFYVLPTINKDMEKPTVELVRDIMSANQQFDKQGGAWFTATAPLLVEQEADLDAATRAIGEIESHLGRLEARNATRAGIWGAPNRALFRAYQEMIAGQRRIAAAMTDLVAKARKGSVSSREQMRIARELFGGEFEGDTGIALHAALMTVVRAGGPEPKIAPAIAAQVFGIAANVSTFRFCAALAPMERVADSTVDPKSWPQACAESRARLLKVMPRLDLAAAKTGGSPELRAAFQALVDRTLALPTASPVAWESARVAQIDPLYEDLLKRITTYTAQHKAN